MSSALLSISRNQRFRIVFSTPTVFFFFFSIYLLFRPTMRSIRGKNHHEIDDPHGAKCDVEQLVLNRLLILFLRLLFPCRATPPGTWAFFFRFAEPYSYERITDCFGFWSKVNATHPKSSVFGIFPKSRRYPLPLLRLTAPIPATFTNCFLLLKATVK